MFPLAVLVDFLERSFRFAPTSDVVLPRNSSNDFPTHSLSTHQKQSSINHRHPMAGGNTRPHLPIFQRTVINGLPWRQELLATVLLTLTLVLLVRARTSVTNSPAFDRSTFLPWSVAAFFVVWIWLSIGWANDRYQALHLALQWTSYLAFFALMIVSGHVRFGLPS
jgi:hypothetical protein